MVYAITFISILEFDTLNVTKIFNTYLNDKTESKGGRLERSLIRTYFICKLVLI